MATRTIHGVEELRSLIGQEVGQSDWIEVTQSMINTFGEVTGDRQWIHMDVERSVRESPFGATISHGFLTLSLLTALHGQSVHIEGDHKMGINYGLNRVRFPSPVRSGSRVRLRTTVRDVRRFSRRRAGHVVRDDRRRRGRQAGARGRVDHADLSVIARERSMLG